MTHVYVVERHCDYEGSTLEEIYAEETDAIAHAKKIMAEYSLSEIEGYVEGDYAWKAEHGSMQITVSKWTVKRGSGS